MAEFMSSIREFLRNLAALFVLEAVLLRLLPGESFARYLRFFLGLILVLFLLRPVAAALSQEDLLSGALNLGEDLFTGEKVQNSEDVLSYSGNSISSSDTSFGSISSGSLGAASELKERIAAASAAEWEEVFQAYQEEILEQMNALVADLGVTVTEISVQSGGEILKIVISGEDLAGRNLEQGGTDGVDAEEKQIATEGVNTQTEESGAEDAAAEPVKIEIPVISVFAGTGETSEDSAWKESDGENGWGGETVEAAGTANVYGSGTAEYSAEEIVALIKERIKKNLGIEEEIIEITGLK